MNKCRKSGKRENRHRTVETQQIRETDKVRKRGKDGERLKERDRERETEEEIWEGTDRQTEKGLLGRQDGIRGWHRGAQGRGGGSNC